MTKQKIFQPWDYVEELWNDLQPQNIAEKKVVKVRRLFGKNLVLTGGHSCRAKDKLSLEFMEAIPLQEWPEDDLEPLDYWEHFKRVDRGERDRTYHGMKITASVEGAPRVVMVLRGPKGEIVADVNLKEDEQLTLF